MKLIKQSYEIIPQENTLEGLYKHIEKCARTCYKSEDKITEGSDKKFVDRLTKSNHGAMLEHGTIYLKLHWEYETCGYFDDLEHFYKTNKYSHYKRCILNEDLCPDIFITTNMRVIVENNRFEDLQYLCNPTEHHHKRITVKFVTDQGILREFTRHRVFSFAVESTRQWRH